MRRLLTGGAWVLAIAGIALPLLPLLGLLLALQEGGSAFERIALPNTLRLIATTAALALVVGGVSGVLGTLLAWVGRRGRGQLLYSLTLLCLIPMAIPSYVLAGAMRESLGPGGWIGRELGLGRFTGFWPAAAALILATTPYVQILVSAALARIPSEEEEAARTLGASPTRVFGVSTWPRIRPAVGLSVLLTQLYTISDFGAVAMLDCPVLTWSLYRAVDNQQLPEAVVLGASLLALSVPLLVIARVIHGRSMRGNVANPRPAPRQRIPGSILTITLAVQSVIISAGVILPIATLIGWVTDSTGPLESLATPLVDTVKVALVGAAVTITAAWCPAWLASWASPRRARMIEAATYASSALPGVLLAFGLLLAALAAARQTSGGAPMYYALTASGTLLILGYAVRFLAEAFAALKTGILNLDPRQLDSARVLGAGFVKTSLRVVLPAVWPAAGAAFVLVTLAIMKELPVTLLLGGAMGLRTLSFRMYDRYQDAFMADAGAAGLLLVVLALAALVINQRSRRAP